VHRKNILIYVQQESTLHSSFYLETALHIFGGTTTNHQERKQLYLQHLVFITPLLLPAAIAAGNGVVAVYMQLLDRTYSVNDVF
jgi:hypothetical protein